MPPQFDGPPLLLPPGGGSPTSASWYRQAAELSRVHRVYAVDLIGAPGRSTPAPGRHPRKVADLVSWLDAVLKGLGLAETDLGGHSYGAWIALHYALRAPHRVRRLVLLDPTLCFAKLKSAYALHALRMPLRPTPRRVRAFLEWETGSISLDPDWLALQEAAVGFLSVRPVVGPHPKPDALRNWTCRSSCSSPGTLGPTTRPRWPPAPRNCCHAPRRPPCRTSPTTPCRTPPRPKRATTSLTS